MTPPASTPEHTASARARIESSFVRQGMMRHLGARVVHVEPGKVQVALPYSDKVTQQQDGFHGGAMGALADIACGYAALTVAEPGMEVTTVEYKINFLASFKDGELQATGRVIRAGKRLIITQGEVTHHAPDGKVSDCALIQATVAPVPNKVIPT
jgi:uncharacterized protein (TIGR00369 family)